MRFHSSCLFRHWSVAVGGLWLVRSHSSCIFRTGQSLLVDFSLCTSTRLVFLTLVSRCWWTLACVLLPVLSFFFYIGQVLLVDFDLCAPTRLVFLTLVSHCWWTLACAFPLVLSFSTLVRRCWRTLACALPLVLSFSHWAVTVGGFWLVHFHSSCLFDIGQVLLVDFSLCAPTCLVFLTWYAWRHLTPCNMHGYIDRCVICMETLTTMWYAWRTLTCALPLVLHFSHWSVTVGGLLLVRFHSSCLFDTGQSLLVDFCL